MYTWDDGSSARVTFAHWLTPHKHDINPQRTPVPGLGTPVALPTFTPTPVATPLPAAATATAEAQPLVTSLSDRGLTPDIVVVRTVHDYEQDKDPQLDRAEQYLKTGKYEMNRKMFAALKPGGYPRDRRPFGARPATAPMSARRCTGSRKARCARKSRRPASNSWPTPISCAIPNDPRDAAVFHPQQPNDEFVLKYQKPM